MSDDMIEQADLLPAAPMAVPEAPVPTESEASVVFKLAQNLARTNFVPAPMRGKPDEVAACILYGREVGIGPMMALRHISVIQGRPTTSAEFMRALVQGRGHRIEVVAWDDLHCTLRGTRLGQGDAQVEVTWTMDDAKRAGLVKGGGAWVQYPRAMLLARATSELCRALFADVVSGLSYTPEELGGEAHPADVGE